MAHVATPATPGSHPPGTTEQNQQDTGRTSQNIAGQAQEKAQQAAGEVRSRAREQVDQRTTQLGEQVASSAQDARSVGEELRKQGKDGPARIADQAAEHAERLGSYLTDADADRVLRDVEDFGRRQPWAVLAGGLVVGFAASRFLKASSRERYRSTHRVEVTGDSPGTPPGRALPPSRQLP